MGDSIDRRCRTRQEDETIHSATSELPSQVDGGALDILAVTFAANGKTIKVHAILGYRGNKLKVVISDETAIVTI